MLLNGGTLDGVSVLKPETVLQMAGKGIPHTSVLRPGVFWGLSMCVFDAPKAAGSARAAGSYGWSGAYGTHFFVDPLHRLEAVLGVNRSNIGGASSPVSAALEAAVRADLLQLG